MNTRKHIYLTGFIIILFASVVITSANQAAGAPMNRNVDTLTAPRPVAVLTPIQATPRMTPALVRAPASTTFIVPELVPTPETGLATAVSPPTNSAARLILPAMLILFSLGALVAWRKRHWAAPEKQLTPKRFIKPGTAILLCLFLLGCQTPEADPLPPDEYLDHALNWIEANAVMATTLDWDAVRSEAVTMAGQPQTTANTYPAIEFAMAQLNDPEAFFRTPEIDVWERGDLGLTAVYPQNIITEVKGGSAAEAANIQVGDQLLTTNGQPPTPEENRPRMVAFSPEGEVAHAITLQLQRGSEQWEVSLTGKTYENEGAVTAQAVPVNGKTAVYLTLFTDLGSRLYPTRTHNALATAATADTCGWIIDLRRNHGGNLWTYFAALSPILGDGELGGFVYTDGSEELWRLENGKVFWADEEREESFVRGRRFVAERPFLPVALLISPLTEAAGELVVVAFQGWGTVRTFGEPTLGAPHLILHTPLSDGALLFVSGARGMDRSGTVYNGAIIPDEPVPTDWQQLGIANDPAIIATQQWLAAQPSCAS